MSPSPTSDSTNIVLIVAVVLVVTAVIIVVVSIVMWKCKVVPKTKTHDYYNHKYLGNTNDIDEILFREQSFMSISAPMATNIHYDKKQPLWTFVFTSSICDILCISLFTEFMYYFQNPCYLQYFFFLSIKIFSFLTFTFGLDKKLSFFYSLWFFWGTICFKKNYIHVLYNTSLFFKFILTVIFYILLLWWTFFFVLDMQSLHCLKILMFTFFYFHTL